MNSAVKITVLATVLAASSAQSWSNNKVYTFDNIVSTTVAPTRDNSGNLILNAMVNFTNLPVNGSYTATQPPYVAIAFTGATQAAGNDAIMCYMSPYAAVTTQTNVTATTTQLWTCVDMNATSATSLDFAQDTPAANQYTYTVTDSFKLHNSTHLTTGFIMSRPYTVGAGSGEQNLTDGGSVNLNWGYGAGVSTPSTFGTSRTAIAARSRFTSTPITVTLPAYQSGQTTNAIVNFAVSMLAFVGLAAFAF